MTSFNSKKILKGIKLSIITANYTDSEKSIEIVLQNAEHSFDGQINSFLGKIHTRKLLLAKFQRNLNGNRFDFARRNHV